MVEILELLKIVIVSPWLIDRSLLRKILTLIDILYEFAINVIYKYSTKIQPLTTTCLLPILI